MVHVKRYSIVIGVTIALYGLANARVLKVGPGGEYPDIQSAIYAAYDGDTVSVASGTVDTPRVYYGPIDFLGKSILVAAREPDTNEIMINESSEEKNLTKPRGGGV